jgi:Rab5 GDP/GTP exchange factor
MGAVQFIENLDRTTLTISDAEFERNVEAAVSAIAEKHQIKEIEPNESHLSEKSGPSRPEGMPRRSSDGEPSNLRRSTSSYGTDGGDGADEKVAISGLLRTIQRPLSSIGRIFSDEGTLSQGGPAKTPQPGSTPRMSPAPRSSNDRTQSPQRVPAGNREESGRSRFAAEDAAARQASAETAEAYRIQRAEHANVVETLAGMFPDLDRDIISDVVTQKNGRYVRSQEFDTPPLLILLGSVLPLMRV